MDAVSPRSTRSYLDRIDVTPGSYMAVCGDCGQEDGPFRSCRLAERALKRLGWRRVPQIEAWDPTLPPHGGWTHAPRDHTWRCGHCLPRWEVALFRRQQENPARWHRRSPWLPWWIR